MSETSEEMVQFLNSTREDISNQCQTFMYDLSNKFEEKRNFIKNDVFKKFEMDYDSYEENKGNFEDYNEYKIEKIKEISFIKDKKSQFLEFVEYKTNENFQKLNAIINTGTDWIVKKFKENSITSEIVEVGSHDKLLEKICHLQEKVTSFENFYNIKVIKTAQNVVRLTFYNIFLEKENYHAYVDLVSSGNKIFIAKSSPKIENYIDLQEEYLRLRRFDHFIYQVREEILCQQQKYK